MCTSMTIDKVFSFRLSKIAEQKLLQKQLPGESLNQTAQRILTMALGMNPPINKKSDLEEHIEKAIDQKLVDVMERLDNLEKQQA